jgi:hypothetical protein
MSEPLRRAVLWNGRSEAPIPTSAFFFTTCNLYKPYPPGMPSDPRNIFQDLADRRSRRWRPTGSPMPLSRWERVG